MSEPGKYHNQHSYQHHPNQPQPVIRFPSLVPPTGAHGGPSVDLYVHSYQAVAGYVVAEGRPLMTASPSV
ncbi:hypothetical protein Hanom_Chr05g00472001 [Helianthus anomalus]